MRLSGTACDGADRSIVCAQFHSCEYGYIRSVHVNNAVMRYDIESTIFLYLIIQACNRSTYYKRVSPYY